MSVFGSISTAVAGLAAQGRALGNLTDNIANSQTIGYKRVDSSFQALVTSSGSEAQGPGGVRARPSYANDIQGTIAQTGSATNLAVSGNGFFQVSRRVDRDGVTAFANEPAFTRAGDFTLDRAGYLTNGSGMALDGWALGSNGTLDKGSIAPIRIQQLVDVPTATRSIDLSANLPMAPATAALPPQTVTVIDAAGAEHPILLEWQLQGPGDWDLSIVAPGSTLAPLSGTQTGINDQSIGPPQTLVAGVTPVAQQSTVLISSVTPGQTYSLTANGVTCSYTAAALDTPSTVGANLFAQISAQQAAANLSGVSVTAIGPTFRINLTGNGNGTPFSIASSPPVETTAATPTPNVVGVTEQIFVPITGTTGEVNDVYSLAFPAFGGPTATYATDGKEGGLTAIAQRMATLINADPAMPMAAQVTAGGIQLTAKTQSGSSAAPVAFTATNGTISPHVDVTFSGGLLSTIGTSHVGSASVTAPINQNTGDPSYVRFQVDYGMGPQTITLNLGRFGQSDGLTQFTGTDLTITALRQDGYTRGAFRNLEIKASGDVVANYDNGRARVLARVPIVEVTDPKLMRRVDGNAFALTREAGGTRAEDPGSNGAGTLVVSSLEGANVDLAEEFTKVIVTQRAYSANTRVVTTADEILNELLAMAR